MKGRLIVLDHVAGQEAAALMVDGVLEDLLIDAPDTIRPGAIFRAICDRQMKGQGGMFLRLPDGERAFLRQSKGLAPGQPLLVQVTGHAVEGKAIPVTTKVLFKSRYAIVTPGAPGLNISRQIREDDERDRLQMIAKGLELPDRTGLILRSSCEGGDADEIADDAVAMAALCVAVMDDLEGSEPEALTEGDGPHGVAWREWVAPAQIATDQGGFETHGVLDQLPGACVKLDAGATMYVEPTRALVAVDVNTGGDTSPAAALKANIAAAKALPRALRLRGLGGQIVLDLAPIPKGQRKQIEMSLRGAFRGDPVETSLVGWTPLGHFELQRKRERLPLDAILGSLGA